MRFSKLLLSIVAICCAMIVILLVFFNKQFVYWELTKIKNSPKAYLDYAYWSVENKSSANIDTVIGYLIKHKEESIKELKNNWEWKKWVLSEQSQIQDAIMTYIIETDDKDIGLKFNNSEGVVTIEQLLKNLNSKIIIGNKEYGPYLFQNPDNLITKIINNVGGWKVTIDKNGKTEVKYGSENLIIRKKD